LALVTSRYVSLRLVGPRYVSLRLVGPRCVSLRLVGPRYVSLALVTSHYVSVALVTSRWPSLRLGGPTLVTSRLSDSIPTVFRQFRQYSNSPTVPTVQAAVIPGPTVKRNGHCHTIHCHWHTQRTETHQSLSPSDSRVGRHRGYRGGDFEATSKGHRVMYGP
jgi:hypothetical protein